MASRNRRDRVCWVCSHPYVQRYDISPNRFYQLCTIAGLGVCAYCTSHCVPANRVDTPAGLYFESGTSSAEANGVIYGVDSSVPQVTVDQLEMLFWLGSPQQTHSPFVEAVRYGEYLYVNWLVLT